MAQRGERGRRGRSESLGDSEPPSPSLSLSPHPHSVSTARYRTGTLTEGDSPCRVGRSNPARDRTGWTRLSLQNRLGRD
jgi:hypothetical protein